MVVTAMRLSVVPTGWTPQSRLLYKVAKLGIDTLSTMYAAGMPSLRLPSSESPEGRNSIPAAFRVAAAMIEAAMHMSDNAMATTVVFWKFATPSFTGEFVQGDSMFPVVGYTASRVAARLRTVSVNGLKYASSDRAHTIRNSATALGGISAPLNPANKGAASVQYTKSLFSLAGIFVMQMIRCVLSLKKWNILLVFKQSNPSSKRSGTSIFVFVWCMLNPPSLTNGGSSLVIEIVEISDLRTTLDVT